MPTPDKHLHEHKVTGQEVFSGHFLQARRDTVRLPDGGDAFREYVVHPGAVMVVPLLTDHGGSLQVVLERQFRYPLGRVMVEFPAGKLDPGEDLWVCAQRELREETGYRAAQWARAGVLHPVAAYSTEFIDIWFARGLLAGPSQLDQGEFLEIITLSPAELFQWCRDGRVTDAKTLAGVFWLQDLLAGAWSPQWRASDVVAPAG